MLNIYSLEQIRSLLNQAKYEGRCLAEEEKCELLEKWDNSVTCNRERIERCKDHNLVDFVLGLKYSAIYDDRSCLFCREYKREVLRIDDDRIRENTLPIHLGCRCIWVPVTKFEIERGKVKFKWSNIKKPDFSLVTL